ncbi:MAG: hypothetical protein GY792_37460 [Gammaproteobacteria bacterium]|nr:hypothetical protein [Gammaproteobacteria bacterium]
MNLTRAYTVHNRVLCTVGRVQTPTLAMIVGRDAQIASFQKTFYYELVAALEEGFSAKYSHRGQTRIDKNAEAERLCRELSHHRTGMVRKIYESVVARFVGVFLPDQVVEETAVTLDIGGAAFVAKGSVVLEEGRTARIEGFISKVGKPFAARLKLGEGFKVEFDFVDGPQREAVSGSDAVVDHARNTAAKRRAPARVEAQSAPASITCPKCGQGDIIEGRRGYGCNRFREGCNFVVWKEISGKQLTEKQIHALIDKGKTRLIKGFNGRSGNKFDARLWLDAQQKVIFEFPKSRRIPT